MKKFWDRKNIQEGLLIISVISVCMAFISVACLPSMQRHRASAWESRAKATLRAFGETQLAYQHTNADKHYGSWYALVNDGWIGEGYDRGNIIEQYSLWTSVYNPFMVSNHWKEYSTFTAVAFPRTTSPPGYLSTFAIREDQVLRAYRPYTHGVNAWAESGDYGALTWEPIR